MARRKPRAQRRVRSVKKVEQDLEEHAKRHRRHIEWNVRNQRVKDLIAKRTAPLEDQKAELIADPENYPLVLLGLRRSRILKPEIEHKISELNRKISNTSRDCEKDTREPNFLYKWLPDRQDGLMGHGWIEVNKLLEDELQTARVREISKAPLRKLKAKAASNVKESRQVASGVRKQLRVDHLCPYCNGPLGFNPHADHIYPVSRGGQSVIENMLFCCNPCNQKKSDLTLSMFVAKYNLNRTDVEKRLKLLGKEF